MFIVSDAKVSEYCPVLWDSFKKFLVFLEKNAFLTQIPPKKPCGACVLQKIIDDDQKIYSRKENINVKINVLICVLINVLTKSL